MKIVRPTIVAFCFLSVLQQTACKSRSRSSVKDARIEYKNLPENQRYALYWVTGESPDRNLCRGYCPSQPKAPDIELSGVELKEAILQQRKACSNLLTMRKIDSKLIEGKADLSEALAIGQTDQRMFEFKPFRLGKAFDDYLEASSLPENSQRDLPSDVEDPAATDQSPSLRLVCLNEKEVQTQPESKLNENMAVIQELSSTVDSETTQRTPEVKSAPKPQACFKLPSDNSQIENQLPRDDAKLTYPEIYRVIGEYNEASIDNKTFTLNIDQYLVRAKKMAQENPGVEFPQDVKNYSKMIFRSQHAAQSKATERLFTLRKLCNNI